MTTLIEIYRNGNVNIKQVEKTPDLENCIPLENDITRRLPDNILIDKSASDKLTFIIPDAGCISLDSLVPNGKLHTDISVDPNYQGIDIEYIPDNEAEYPDETTRPRVLIKKPVDTKQLTAMLWADPTSEDYSYKQIFEPKE